LPAKDTQDSEGLVISVIKIMTDSTVYLRRAEAEEMNIKIIPIIYTLKGVRSYEYYSDTTDGFEKYLASGEKITTSQPGPAVFADAFREELRMGNEILCITLSSRLSGIYNSALTAAREVRSPNIYVFDSRLTAGGLYLLINEARKLADSGVNIKDIMFTLPKIRDKITTYFSVSDMTPLRESGRIGFVRMSVGTILNIKPILFCRDGVVVHDSTVHGTNETIRKLIEKMPSGAKGAVINYISNNSTASNLYNIMKSNNPALPVRLSRLGPVLTAHLGLQVLAVSYITDY
jgi:DegV family protein with EDD domain